MKRVEDSLRDLWDILNVPTFKLLGPRGRRKKKDTEKIFEETIVENFPNMGKEIARQIQEENPLQYKPKEKHIETHINQANRD